VVAFERLIGRKLDIEHYYRPWTANWPDGRERWNFDAGRIPMISWGKTDLRQIVSGALDNTIRARAQGVAALRKPLFLRWFWEMDGKHNGEGGPFSVTGPDFVAAWKHIRGIFEAEGARNAVFVWCPNAWAFDTGRGPAYYPGDDQVDWICADGYDWFPANKGARDLSFRAVFQKFYDWASQRPKPLMIGEYGALEHGTGHKGRWLEDAHHTIKSAFPRIKALVYFNHKGLPQRRPESARASTSGPPPSNSTETPRIGPTRPTGTGCTTTSSPPGRSALTSRSRPPATS
jgi:hypothetical protein